MEKVVKTAAGEGSYNRPNACRTSKLCTVSTPRQVYDVAPVLPVKLPGLCHTIHLVPPLPLCAAKSAPFLTEVLQASLDCVHLDIDYDSRSGLSRRRIYPYGLFAAQGFWYCACYDYKRGMSLSLRVDRFRSVERVADLKPPTDLSLREWLRTYQRDAGDTLHLRAVVRGQGTKSLELTNLFGEITADERGEAVLDTHIPAAEIDFYASRLLTLGMDLHVESPPQLIEALRQRAQAIADLYSRVGSHP